MEVEIQIRIEASARDLPIPNYMTPGSSGLDLLASESVMIGAGDWAKVCCGFSIAIPIGYEGQVRPRSGIALEYGVTVLNAPGTIDADYRGLVQVILINHGTRNYQVERGARIPVGNQPRAPCSTENDGESGGNGTGPGRLWSYRTVGKNYTPV